MSCFYFQLKSGRNGYDHALYIARQGFHASRGDLISSGHGNLPNWANDEPKRFWRAAESGERRNGSIYRELIIALPNELSHEENKRLVDDLLARFAPGKPYQFAIHEPTSALEGEPNPHLHLMMSDRVDDGIEREPGRFFSRYNASAPALGGRKKASGGRNAMELRDEVLAKRKLVAETINRHLQMNGHESRVDHRSLRQQGIERRPEVRMPKFWLDGMSEKEKSQYVADRKKNKSPK